MVFSDEMIGAGKEKGREEMREKAEGGGRRAGGGYIYHS